MGPSRGCSKWIFDGFFDVAGDPSDDVVFIGHLGRRPNVDAAQWLVEKVWPLLRLKSHACKSS